MARLSSLIALLAAAGVGWAVLRNRRRGGTAHRQGTRPAGAQAEAEAARQAQVDEALKESFPASDAPSYSGPSRVGRPAE